MAFKVVLLPEFQEWALRSVFHQEIFPVPPLLQGIAEQEISFPRPQDRLAPPRRLRRSISAKCMRSLEGGDAQTLVGRKDSEGELVPCMRVDGRRRRKPRSELAVCKTSSLATKGTFRSLASEASALSMGTTLAGKAADNAIQKRANVQGICMLLDKLAFTSVRRAPPKQGGRRAAAFPSQGVESARIEIGMAGNNFDTKYGCVQDTIKEFVSFRPLRRGHTICLGERAFCRTHCSDRRRAYTAE